MDVDASQKWWAAAVKQFQQHGMPASRDISRFQLDVLARALVSTLFSRDGHCSFPDTFYLDQDRLRVLKSEIDDLIHFEICSDMFAQLLKEFGHEGSISPSTRQHIRTSVSAIMGEAAGHGPQAWMVNSEPISLELYRQALLFTGRPPIYNLDDFQKANQHLRALFVNSFSAHASALQATLLPQILACANRYRNASTIDLFNNLVAPTPPPPHGPFPSFMPIAQQHPDTLPSNTTQPERLADVSNRITHILLLHWRIWGPIAYIQDDENTAQNQMPLQALAQPQPQHVNAMSTLEERAPSTAPHAARPPAPSPPPPNGTPEAQVVGAMKTGEPPDPGTETKVTGETRWPHLQ